MGGVRDVITCAKFEIEILFLTILQGVEFSIFLLIFAWALQQCSANPLPMIDYGLYMKGCDILNLKSSGWSFKHICR